MLHINSNVLFISNFEISRHFKFILNNEKKFSCKLINVYVTISYRKKSFNFKIFKKIHKQIFEREYRLRVRNRRVIR